MKIRYMKGYQHQNQAYLESQLQSIKSRRLLNEEDIPMRSLLELKQIDQY